MVQISSHVKITSLTHPPMKKTAQLDCYFRVCMYMQTISSKVLTSCRSIKSVTNNMPYTLHNHTCPPIINKECFVWNAISESIHTIPSKVLIAWPCAGWWWWGFMGSNDPPSPKRGHLTFTLESLESIHIYIRVRIARSVENQSGNA